MALKLIDAAATEVARAERTIDEIERKIEQFERDGLPTKKLHAELGVLVAEATEAEKVREAFNAERVAAANAAVDAAHETHDALLAALPGFTALLKAKADARTAASDAARLVPSEARGQVRGLPPKILELTVAGGKNFEMRQVIHDFINWQRAAIS